MDVGLGRLQAAGDDPRAPRLNPCFSGCWSRTVVGCGPSGPSLMSLNPCFSGCWSRTISGSPALSPPRMS